RLRRRQVIFEDDGPVTDKDGWYGFIQIDWTEDPGSVPGAVLVSDDTKARPVQFELADGKLAVEDLLLVVIDDAAGYINQVGFFGVMLAGEAEFAERDAAQEAKAGGLKGNLRPQEMRFELGDHLFLDDRGARQMLIEPAGSGHAAQDGEYQATNQ